MLVMSDTPVVICSYALMDIEARPRQCADYDNRHAGRIPDDLRNCFSVLKKCQNKLDCLINEMLRINVFKCTIRLSSR